MKHLQHQAEFCVVGGGLSGMCAAIAAARHGVKTVLMHDRPVLGGNASSEIRMWICGASANGENCRETGIIEEILLDNIYRNGNFNYSIWDSILFEKVKFQPNLTVLLNCSCNSLEMDGSRIKSVKGWQLTTETWHSVEAKYFADCSGDSILAPLSGAEFRIGREARSEFNESIAPEQADMKTMGMSCLLQARETDRPQQFIPPEWANVYASDAELPNRIHDLNGWQNFWWLETGGENDSIHDTEELRDKLLKIAFGVWDHIKNHGDHGATNWVLEWVGFLPGKRESRRYVGDHIMTQNDVRAEGRFEDIIAYGGWSMDDHHPAGFDYPGKPTIFHEAPCPYGIPYRCIYSKNIENLLFAGRNISCTHSAMSSTRVMATCATLGQAAGTAVAVASRHNLTPRQVYAEKIDELKQTLMDDDCYLPWNSRKAPELSAKAKLSASAGAPEMLRNGNDRQINSDLNAWQCGQGDFAEYSWTRPEELTECRIVFDSDVNVRILNSVALYPLDIKESAIPETLVKGFHLEIKDLNGNWSEIFRATNNHQRFIKIPLNAAASAIRLVIDDIRGQISTNVFRWDIR